MSDNDEVKKIPDDYAAEGDLQGLEISLLELFNRTSGLPGFSQGMFDATKFGLLRNVTMVILEKARAVFKGFIDEDPDTWDEKYNEMVDFFNLAQLANLKIPHYPMWREIWDLKKACYLKILSKNVRIGTQLINDSSCLTQQNRDDIFHEHNKLSS